MVGTVLASATNGAASSMDANILYSPVSRYPMRGGLGGDATGPVPTQWPNAHAPGGPVHSLQSQTSSLPQKQRFELLGHYRQDEPGVT